MEICLIWAQDLNGAIGKAGTLPWHLPEDMKRFKALTTGHPVIMGRRTWESLKKMPLADRQNFVITKSSHLVGSRGVACPSLEDALEQSRALDPERVYIIGGGELYRHALPVATRILSTHIHVVIPDADVFAPDPPPDDWVEFSQSPRLTSATGLSFHYREMTRRPK